MSKIFKLDLLITYFFVLTHYQNGFKISIETWDKIGFRNYDVYYFLRSTINSFINKMKQN